MEYRVSQTSRKVNFVVSHKVISLKTMNPSSSNWSPFFHQAPSPLHKKLFNPLIKIVEMLVMGGRGRGVSSNQYDWTPVECLNVLHHNRTIEREISCYTKIFYYTCKNFIYHIFIKKLYGELLGIFLTPIPTNKIVSDLKEFITSDLNTKVFVLHRQN